MNRYQHYQIEWTAHAEYKLRHCMDTLIQHFDPVNAQKFYNSVKKEVAKLALTAHMYRFKSEIIIKKHYKIRFKILGNICYITTFNDMRKPPFPHD